MAFTDILTKYLGFFLPEPKHDMFETLFYRNQNLLDCILNSINSENRLVAGTYNSGTGQLEGIRVKFVFGGAVSLVDFPNTAVTIVATPQIWCANRVSGTISAINLAEYAQMVITPDDFPILYTGHHNDTHATTAPFANMIAPLNHNTQEQIRLNNPKVNEDVQVVATSSEINSLGSITGSLLDTGSDQDVIGVKTFTGGIRNITSDPAIGFKTVEIGPWNMNHSGGGSYEKFVNHGLIASNIISFEAYIRHDDLVHLVRPLNFLSGGSVSGGIYLHSTTQFRLQAVISGSWDNTGYNDTSINRGYVFVSYYV